MVSKEDVWAIDPEVMPNEDLDLIATCGPITLFGVAYPAAVPGLRLLRGQWDAVDAPCSFSLENIAFAFSHVGHYIPKSMKQICHNIWWRFSYTFEKKASVFVAKEIEPRCDKIKMPMHAKIMLCQAFVTLINRSIIDYDEEDLATHDQPERMSHCGIAGCVCSVLNYQHHPNLRGRSMDDFHYRAIAHIHDKLHAKDDTFWTATKMRVRCRVPADEVVPRTPRRQRLDLTSIDLTSDEEEAPLEAPFYPVSPTHPGFTPADPESSGYSPNYEPTSPPTSMVLRRTLPSIDLCAPTMPTLERMDSLASTQDDSHVQSSQDDFDREAWGCRDDHYVPEPQRQLFAH